MKQFIVVGLGRFGASVARTLSEKGYDVMAIDKDEELIQDLSSSVTHAVQANATDEEALKALGVGNFDVAVVSIGADVHSNILATLILKELGVPYVVVKAQNELHGKVLKKVGADKVVYPERDMGHRIALNLISSNVLDFIEFAPDYSIMEIIPPEEMVHQSIGDLQLRSRFGVNVLAINRKNGRNNVIVSPSASDKIEQGDRLVVMGTNKQLNKLRDE
ncbi:MAG: TrkA family potassium uptake protein [Halanaerobium sp.]|nr:TrkA family potassium uptake protein [Halanaerobium sp.]